MAKAGFVGSRGIGSGVFGCLSVWMGVMLLTVSFCTEVFLLRGRRALMMHTFLRQRRMVWYCLVCTGLDPTEPSTAHGNGGEKKREIERGGEDAKLCRVIPTTYL